MKFVYLITAFNTITWREYLPDPCVFETKREADWFCKVTERKHIHCSYKQVRVGKYKQVGVGKYKL